MHHSRLERNLADECGGALYAATGGKVHLAHSGIHNNHDRCDRKTSATDTPDHPARFDDMRIDTPRGASAARPLTAAGTGQLASQPAQPQAEQAASSQPDPKPAAKLVPQPKATQPAWRPAPDPAPGTELVP